MSVKLGGSKILRVVVRTESEAAKGSLVPDGLGGRPVTSKTNREVVERYVNGMKARDLTSKPRYVPRT